MLAGVDDDESAGHLSSSFEGGLGHQTSQSVMMVVILMALP